MGLTDWVMIGSTVALVAFDIVVAVTGKPTISQKVRSYAGKYPMIPFALGVLIGHWLWPV